MDSASSSHRRGWATPVIPTEDPTQCRVYSIPASLLPTWEGCIGLLCAAGLWTRGDDVSSASVEDVTAAYAEIIDAAFEKRGCGMIGQIIEVALQTLPDWMLACDGAEYLQADYPELMAVINPAYVTDGTHFRTPDRNNRIGLMGPIAGVQGGENTHTLTSGEMPAHAHTDLGHQHGYTSPFGEFLALTGEEPVVLLQTPAATDTGAANIQNTGGGGSHNNMQAYEGTQYALVVR